MRLPFATYGRRELLLYGGLFLALAVAVGFWHPWAAVLPGLGCLATLNFFRDPERAIPPEHDAVVSPADGTVTDVTEMDERAWIGERAVRVGIFLSIFDVHVNRSPADAEVRLVQYRKGRFHSALKPECAAENESNLLGLAAAPSGVRMTVKQISGAIARRIVCPLSQGSRVAKGERIGMIKFGSRTELYLPASARPEVLVKKGDRVRGGQTILFRLNLEK